MCESMLVAHENITNAFCTIMLVGNNNNKNMANVFEVLKFVGRITHILRLLLLWGQQKRGIRSLHFYNIFSFFPRN